LALGAAVLLLAPIAFGQTTGQIQGRVVDDSGEALPGVTVSANSPALQGQQVAVTGADGRFNFRALPPGTYTLNASLEGFNTVEQPDVSLGIDQTKNLTFTMSGAFGGEITVTGAAPLVDTTTQQTGVNVSSEDFQNLPLARDVYAVAQVATGVSGVDKQGTAEIGPRFYGSTGAENQYVIEGLNTTGVELGTQAKQLNTEFISDVQIVTGGLQAEYGRLTGGMINVITKSGGNEFTGDVFGYFEGGSLQSDDSTAGARPRTTTQVINVDEKADYGFDLGGALVKDKLWYFVAYDRVDQTDATEIIGQIDAPGSPQPGETVGADIESDLYAAKLTYRLSDAHTLTGSFFGDPTTRTGNVFVVSGPPVTWEGETETGSDDYVLRYDGLFGGSWVAEAAVGRHQEENFTTGPGHDIPALIDLTVVPNAVLNGFGFHQNQEFQRDVYRANISAFAGDHEVKFGGDVEKLDAYNENWNGGGGQRIYQFQTGGVLYYRHRYYVDDRAPGFDRANPASWTIAAPLVSEPTTDNSALFAQDSWRVLPNLTVNAGVRWERQEVGGRDGTTQIDLDDNWAPRLGFAWDVLGNGRSKLYGNFGRYYEAIPMDINIRAFGGEIQCFCYNFSANPADTEPDPAAPRLSSLLGGSTEPVDPDLEGQYIDEVMFGYEYEVRPNLALGIQGTYRNLGQVIEDFLTPGGSYFIANPGTGLGSDVTFYDYYYYDDPAIFSAPAPEADREFMGLEVSARKRFSDGWQLFASYLYSRLEGNYDGLFQASTGQLDPNINSAFDYADFTVNAEGDLSNDTAGQFKFYGSYLVQKGALEGLNVGLGGFYNTGLPLTAYGYSFAYANYEFYLTPRGSLGRGPDYYEMDLHLGYPIRLANDMELNLLVDVFNLLDQQSEILLDQRYNLSSDDFCAGIPAELCSTMGGINNIDGTTDPIGALPNPRATATNPDFLSTATQFTGQRNVRLGVRLTF
jgi:outer membrane receptor protein involved in Fe transport